MSRALLLLAAAAGLAAAACSEPAERPEDARARLEAALERRDRPAALRALRALRRSLPDDADARLELGEGLVRAGEAPEAVWVFEEGLTLDPDHLPLRLALARAALRTQDPARARSVLAAPAAASSPEAALLRAEAELGLGHREAAEAALRAAAAASPESPEPWLSLGSLRLQERAWAEARTAFVQARARLAGDPRAASADVAIALLDARQGDPTAAIERLRAWARERPGELDLWRGLSALLVGTGRGDEAVAVLTEAVAAAPSPGLHALRASLLEALGRDTEARAELERLVRESGSAAATLRLAEFLRRHGDPDGALAVLREGRELDPDRNGLRAVEANLLLDLDRATEARAHVVALRRAHPESPEAGYLEARLRLAEGDAAGAARRLERLLPRFDVASAQFWLGRALERLGRWREADRRYALARRRDPRDPAPTAARVRLALARGDPSRARALALAWLRERPEAVATHVALAEAWLRADPASAGPHLEALGEAHPDDPDVRAVRARGLRLVGRPEAALELLGRDPAPAAVEAERALARLAAGRPDAALAGLDAARAREPAETGPLRLARALVLFERGRADEAEREIDRALAASPRDPSPFELRARYRATHGDPEGALRDAEAYLRLRPADPEMGFVRAALLDELGRADDAVAAYRHTVGIDPRAAHAHNNLALLLAARGDRAGALEHAQRAYRHASDDAAVLDTLGGLYVEAGFVDRGIALLERAVAANPASEEARRRLADARETRRRSGAEAP